MTESTDEILPLIWRPAAKPALAESAPVDLGILSPTDGQPATAVPLLLCALYGLCLRYAGTRDITFGLRQPPDGPGYAASLDYGALAAGSALGPTLAQCHAAVRAALAAAGWPGEPGSQRTGGDTVRSRWEMAVHGSQDASGPGRETGPRDIPVFVFERGPAGEWSARLRLPRTPADPSAGTRILSHLAVFTRACLDSPQARVGEISHLTPAERHLIERVNETARKFDGQPACLHHLFEEASRRHPGNIAVIHAGRRITHAELDEKANTLAAGMIANGVGIGDRVGVLATRSAEFVVAAIAVLKAGAAYVPLDPLLPAARLSALFKAGNIHFLLAEPTCQEVATGLFPKWQAIPAVQDIQGTPREHVTLPHVRGEDLAYIIFTSGSSGPPKAVLLDHLGRVNLLLDLNDHMGMTHRDRGISISSPSFDASVMEIFCPLIAGGSIVLPDRGREYDIDHWADLILAEGVSVWNSVPPALAQFLRTWEGMARRVSGDVPGRGRLRLFIVGGDWIPLDLPARVASVFPDAEMQAIGGSTEVSVCTTFYRPGDAPSGRKSIPYGHPMANQTTYIVDAFGQLAALDQAGELLLGGVGVGWGYDVRPALTAERFVPDPFGDLPGGRLYRTGDEARLRADGEIELLGRLDQQVKINGVRAELGEIQGCLLRQPGVASTVVVPHRDEQGRVLALVAFVVPETGHTPGPGDTWPAALRAQMEAELPRAMVPQRIVVLDELPVNSNGKIDHRRLATLAAARVADSRGGGAPGTRAAPADEIGRAVAEIWRDVLGLGDLPAAEDEFVSLGGGSLAAMQVASRLSVKFSAEIKVGDLFATGTVAQIAALIRQRRGAARAAPELVRRRR